MENNTANMVLIPEENVYINFEITEDKPFNKCFSCNSFRNGCSGPNLFAMGVKRACEFLQMARMYLRRLYPDKYSYQYCADETGLGITTIKKLLTGKIEDPSFYTMKKMSDLLIGDPSGKFPCACPDIVYGHANMAELAEASVKMEQLVKDNDEYKAALDGIHASYRTELDIQRVEHKAEVDTIRAEHKEAMAAKEVYFNTLRLHLVSQIEHQRNDIEFLRKEIDRRSVLIDKFMEKQFSQGNN